MVNYKIVKNEIPELDTFSNFDDLLTTELTEAEVRKILELLRPYFSSEVFAEHGAVEFRYFPSGDNDDEGTPYRFVISKQEK